MHTAALNSRRKGSHEHLMSIFSVFLLWEVMEFAWNHGVNQSCWPERNLRIKLAWKGRAGRYEPRYCAGSKGASFTCQDLSTANCSFLTDVSDVSEIPHWYRRFNSPSWHPPASVPSANDGTAAPRLERRWQLVPVAPDTKVHQTWSAKHGGRLQLVNERVCHRCHSHIRTIPD